jgi:hypothetical protein
MRNEDYEAYEVHLANDRGVRVRARV